MRWQPSLGAWPDETGTNFRVWAPDAKRVDLVLYSGGDAVDRTEPMQRRPDRTFFLHLPGVGAGQRYRYAVDGGPPFPDPCSRYQPEGVHGPSQVIDPRPFPWADHDWKGARPEDLVVYELHVGTFSPAGTFAGVTERLPYLRDLGVTAVELMPVADFPGRRNWGYDGVALFAPARCYGTPDELRRLVDRAHALGLAVLLDVVYNHFGPDGNYTGVYSPYYVSKTHTNPWGASLNFDGPHAEMVRFTFIENALHWLGEYHFDGLRLDATHAIPDDSPRHFLAELTAKVREGLPDRRAVLIAEDHRNLAHMVRPHSEGGWGLDAVWADDFHHEMRRLLAGDDEGYYRDFRGSVEDLATILNKGWLFCGQYSEYLGEHRGTDPAGLPPHRFVICIQNHDQIGNRAFGERLNHQIDPAAYRAAGAVLLLAPQTPLLFQGQEWAAGTPFLYFTDHNQELGKLVTEGRRREFKTFKAFSDPQAESTFLQSRLRWDETEREPHASTLRLYRRLLALRRSEPALGADGRAEFRAEAIDPATLLMRHAGKDGSRLVLVARLKGGGTADLAEALSRAGAGGPWETALTTEDAPFAPDARPPRIELEGNRPRVEFARPGAVLLKSSGG
ncbi:MAG TPA: malto-oligosyltrehalose trehalohydrolase [Gemmataceae bacterium]